MHPSDWPSLAPQAALAKRLFGPRGPALMGSWLDAQVGHITDRDFARLFSDHIDLPGIAPSDYNHRLVRAAGGRLLGGIRFHGHDLARPFVEVVAHDFEGWGALQDCVAAEWRAFAPLHLRVLVTSGAAVPPNAHLDVSVHLACLRDMAPPDGRVTLAPFSEAEEAVAMVAARYRALAEIDPELARNVSVAEPDDLRAWHAEGHLVAIHADVGGAETTVGLLAIAPGAVAWIEGCEVNEEVVATAHGGHGFAASAQRAWAARADVDPDRLLVGTIDRRNGASRRAAVRAGRSAVLDYVFLPMKGCERSMTPHQRGPAVLHPFGDDLWIADGPEVVVAGFVYPTRMAVVRLPGGGLWLWSPVRPSPALRAAIDALGPVRHLVAPNSLHHLALPAWAEAYPEARVHAAPGLRRKRTDIALHADLGDVPDPAWADVIEQVVVRGNLITREVVFLHRPSGTVLVTDLIQQLPPERFGGWRRVVARLDLMTEAAPTVPRKFRLATVRRGAARAAVRRILDWPTRRVVMAHGVPVEEDGQVALRRAFQWLRG